jgi:hypothetical protein
MAVFNGKAWLPETKPGDTKLVGAALTADGGHAANQYAVIRRWTAPRGGLVSIEGTLAHPANYGDGIEGKIVSSRVGVIGDWPLFKRKTDTKFPKLAVAQDETLDFIVEPRSNSRGDSFAWAPTIRMTGPSNSPEQPMIWNASSDFVGQTGERSMDGWEKLAQVLLETNELAFIN